MFSAPFVSAFATSPHSSQTYNPRSTRWLSDFVPQAEQVFDVSRSETVSTAIPRISALYSSIVVKRSNAHPWRSRFPWRPILRAVVAVADAAEVADEHRADAAFGALHHDAFRESVEEVRAAVGALPVETARFAGERVVALRALFGEVVFVLLERATGIRSVG